MQSPAPAAAPASLYAIGSSARKALAPRLPATSALALSAAARPRQTAMAASAHELYHHLRCPSTADMYWEICTAQR